MFDPLGDSVNDDAFPTTIIGDIFDLQANIGVFPNDLKLFPFGCINIDRAVVVHVMNRHNVR